MRKLGKFLIVGALAAIGVAALAGCGAKDYSGTYNGEYKYESPWGGEYGVQVTVVVEGDVIKSVTCGADTDDLFNITSSWDNHDTAAAGLDNYLKSFEGAKVDDIKALSIPTVTAAEADDYTPAGQPKNDDAAHEAQGKYLYTGATQTSGRIILAVQNALENLVEVK